MTTRARFRRRLLHHVTLGVAAVCLTVLAGLAAGGTDLRFRASMGTAYAGLIALAVSLILGPLNVLRRRPNPVSSDLRRDVGIWAGLIGLLHVGIGLTVHLRGHMLQYFVPPPEQRGVLPIRADPFGAANYLGVLAGLILLGLLLLSSDRALRWLGSASWKRWQRFNYLVLGAVILHGALYQLIEKRRIALIVLFLVLLGVPLVFQGLGFRTRRAGVDRTHSESSLG